MHAVFVSSNRCLPFNPTLTCGNHLRSSRPPILMSTSNQPNNSSSSNANFTKIFDAATNEYKNITGQDLGTHPFGAALDKFNSPDDIVDVFQTQSQAFTKVFKGQERLMICLTPIVQILFRVSAVLDNSLPMVSLSFHSVLRFFDVYP